MCHGRSPKGCRRLVEGEVHRLADGGVLDVVLSEHGLLTSLQLDKLLINVLPVSMNLFGIVFAHIETSEETLR
jgi:hypothetical protein